MQVPQRLYTLDELKLNGIQTSSLLSPVDATLGSIERNLQLAAALGGLAVWNVLRLSPQQILYFSLGLLFLWTLDSVIPLYFSLSLSLLSMQDPHLKLCSENLFQSKIMCFFAVNITIMLLFLVVV